MIDIGADLQRAYDEGFKEGQEMERPRAFGAGYKAGFDNASKIEDFIYKELDRMFSVPCNYSPMDDIMLESGRCENDCGEVSGAECWRRYFEEKIKIERGNKE